MKMSSKGKIEFLDVWLYSTETTADYCRATTYDNENDVVVYLMEVVSEQLRPHFKSVEKYSELNYDALIVVMEPSGRYKYALNINYDQASVSISIGPHSLFSQNGNLFFGTSSYGFKTKHQNVTYDIEDPKTDSHLFKFNHK